MGNFGDKLGDTRSRACFPAFFEWLVTAVVGALVCTAERILGHSSLIVEPTALLQQSAFVCRSSIQSPCMRLVASLLSIVACQTFDLAGRVVYSVDGG